MYRTPRALLLALVSLPVIGHPGWLAGQDAPAKTRVESQLLLASQPGLQFGVSPKGMHLVAMVLRGSRQVMVMDGVDGPKFDQILNQNRVVWSDEGSHFAYVGKVGQEYVIMVDNKEVARGPWSPELATIGQNPVYQLDFTPGGKHWYYIRQSRTPGREHYQMVLDGVPGPVADAAFTPVFSRDGEHHFYYLERHPLTGQPSQVLIHDGKVAPYLAENPQFTADGLHLFTRRGVPGAGAMDLLADGQPIMRAPIISQLYMSPVGAGMLAVVWSISASGSRSAFLTIGARKVPGSECPDVAGIDAVYISSDAKHYAARCPRAWILADGKRGQEYPGGLSDVIFTADGRAVYQAITNNRTFLVVGDQESDGYSTILFQELRTRAGVGTVANTPAQVAGNHVGFIGRTDNNGDATVVVVDGKATPAVAAQELMFSPDGSRSAFISGRPTAFVTVDGIAHSGVAINPTAAYTGFQRNLIWSSDSKHLAYAGIIPGSQSPYGLMIDGKFFSTPAAPRNIAFTPDGRHLVWATRGSQGPQQLIFVDGEQVLQLPLNQQMLENEADIYWSMGADGILSFVAQDEEGAKRFRVTPGSGTSVETLLAKAVKPRG